MKKPVTRGPRGSDRVLKVCKGCRGSGKIPKPGTHNELVTCTTCKGERVR